jgi:hypothetical protein
MRYEYTAIPDGEVPQAVEPTFQHAVTIYASEAGPNRSTNPGSSTSGM